MNNSHKEIVANEERRAARRYKVNLKASVIITAVNRTIDNEESYLVLQAQLLDVSKTGLALLISYTDASALKKSGGDLIFRLLLPLPAEAIELEVVPVRYRVLEGTSRILVGANITNMNGRDRILFMDFINEFEDSSSVAE